MTGADSSAASFLWGFDAGFRFGAQDSCRGYFGRDVLAGLISGIDDFRAGAEREPGFRTLGPAMLGAFMWLDDPELVERIACFPHACVVITKQPRDPRQQARVDKLKPVLARCPGFPTWALPELRFLGPRLEDVSTPVVGPDTPIIIRHQLSALRTIGYRKAGDRLVPILHAKMVLLGELWRRGEEDPEFPDGMDFRPQKLWLGSANGTASSRANLEFGIWVTDPDLLREATRFLGGLMAHSEVLDPDAPDMEPELVKAELDLEAFFPEAVVSPDEAEEGPW